MHTLGANQVHVFGIKVSDHSNLILFVANKFTLTVIALGHTLRASETSIQLAGMDRVHVGHRSVSRYRDRDQSWHTATAALVAGA